jgi:hypothetical protein
LILTPPLTDGPKSRISIMAKFDTYRDTFPHARLTRKGNGVLEVALHTDGGKLVYNGYTHEQFVDLFHQSGEDRENRAAVDRVDRWIENDQQIFTRRAARAPPP